MIIGVSGKIGSGKDETGIIIQYLLGGHNEQGPYDEFKKFIKDNPIETLNSPDMWGGGWKIKKFADKLKDIVCLLIGCTREQLEDREFKEKELGEEWWYEKMYAQIGGAHYFKMFKTKEECKNWYDEKVKNLPHNSHKWSSNTIKLTPRKLLQLLGTECGRNIIHPNIWVNSLFAGYGEYKGDEPIYSTNVTNGDLNGIDVESRPVIEYPNWIITDVRFSNEAKAIKDIGGILIRVNRPQYAYNSDLPINANPLEHAERGKELHNHPSETALDNYQDWDYVIDNNGTIEELIEKVKVILIKENIIKDGG